MRVAFDATPLLDVRTGVGAFTEEVLARLAYRADLEIIGFGLTRIYLDDLRAKLPAGVTSVNRPIPLRMTRRLWLRFDWPAIEWWTGSVDIVHGPNFVVPPARRAVELMSVHDLTPVRYPEMCDDNTRQYPTLIRRSLDRGAHVQTASQFVADEIVDAFGVDPGRVHAIPYGVTPVRTGDPASGTKLAGGDRYLLALGTLEPRKNLVTLVRAFDDVAGEDGDIRLVLAGGPGWGSDDLGQVIAQARHGTRIVRPGRVDEQQKADLLAGAAMLAYPSVYEGFGLPPLEAMSVGVPVLASTAGSLPEVLGDAAVLVAPERETIAEGIQQVLSDGDLQAELIRRGAERAGRYSWDRCADSVAGLYRQLAA